MPRSLEDLLVDVPLFEGLGDEARTLLAGCARNIHFAAGERIFREGGEADLFYLVRHGSVAVESFVPTRGAVTIETIEAGDVLGWSWLFPPYRWHFDARALSVVRATAFDGLCLREKCERDPAFGYTLMGRFAQVLIDRLQWTRLRLLDVYGNGDRH
jgi:CRP/FNR family transcriptional regulator, cyclic AMP receptor protein